MTKLILITILSLVLSQSEVNNAQKDVEEKLQEINEYLYKSGSCRGFLSKYFERLTAIRPENYFDSFILITENDYINWKKWYEENKELVTSEYLEKNVFRVDTFYNENGDTTFYHIDTIVRRKFKE